MRSRSISYFAELDGTEDSSSSLTRLWEYRSYLAQTIEVDEAKPKSLRTVRQRRKRARKVPRQTYLSQIGDFDQDLGDKECEVLLADMRLPSLQTEEFSEDYDVKETDDEALHELIGGQS
jgi:hypothetical protein